MSDQTQQHPPPSYAEDLPSTLGNLPNDPPPPTPHIQIPAGAIPIDPGLNAFSSTAADNTTATTQNADITMTDATTTTNPPPPTIPPLSTTTTTQPPNSPLPTRVSTPPVPARNPATATANSESDRSGSRAASAHPDPGSGSKEGSKEGPKENFTMPTEAPLHGAPLRQYMNTKVTGVLLEGMKMLAMEQPKDPLRVLGEYLLARSKETETS
ncbi:hypothetical protein QBC47DRAFT_374112 [Echria macrotheca]|uniref:Dpy-30 domain-containing protein n=1 Tax=Echria macrotheca TaxID=438768 RepID=A0AAJ0BHY6_9PEZI|nr:hypothetical protein QBC47DRAFT_374112 [Echria macrotheca]